jgi:hypothetical protein
MIFTTGLWIYHNELIRKNLTTKEELKNVYQPPIGNPFLRTLGKNIQLAIFPTISKFSLLERMREKKLKQMRDRSRIVILAIFLKKFYLFFIFLVFG